MDTTSIHQVMPARASRLEGGQDRGLALWRAAAFVLLAALLLAAGSAWAQSTGNMAGVPANPMTIIDQGANEDGVAERIMRGLLGESFNAPFTLAMPSTIFGYMFAAFNIFVFAAAVAWGTYGVTAGIVQTAHEGVVLGKRLSAIWLPIRLVTGVGSLVPAFGGFSLSQALMIMALGWGINGANFITSKAVEAFSTFAPLTQPSIVSGRFAHSGQDLATALFLQELCVRGTLKHNAQMGAGTDQGGGASGTVQVPPGSLLVDNSHNFNQYVDDTVSTSTKIRNWFRQNSDRGGVESKGYVFGTKAHPMECMGVGITRRYVDLSGGIIARQYRNENVGYEAVNEQAYRRYEAALAALRQDITTVADNFIRAADEQRDRADADKLVFPYRDLSILGIRFTDAVSRMPRDGQASDSTNAGNSNDGLIKAQAMQQIKSLGFLSLGSYYGVISEANNAITQAQDAAEIVILTKKGKRMDAANHEAFQEQFGSGSSKNRYMELALKSMKETQEGAAGDPLSFELASGGRSWGQIILNHTLGAAITGTDRAASFRLIDPIVSAKNLGDYMMTFGSTVIIGGKVLDWITSFFKKGDSSGDGGGGGGKASFISTLAWVFLILGALLAIYIPMVPFLNWVSAMVQYVSTVVQAFVAAPLWSFAHVAVDGEGMGQRAERGYLFLMLVLFKPSLMVIAFFAAAGMVILIGSAVTWMFMLTVSNVQGNSVTGLVTVVFFVMMYFIILNLIVQSSFNLVEEISDDVIGWVGQAGKSGVGRGMDDRMGNVFIAGTRAVRSDASVMMSAGRAAGR